MLQSLSVFNGVELVPLRVEVADTRLKRVQGLSDRPLDSLLADAMLFTYETPTYAAFTMNKMLFALTIVWFDERGGYIGQRDTDMEDDHPIVPPGRYQYVLEFPVGEAPRFGKGSYLEVLEFASH